MNIKRILLIMTAAMLCVMLCGCGLIFGGLRSLSGSNQPQPTVETDYEAAAALNSVTALLDESAPAPEAAVTEGDAVAELIYTQATYSVLSADGSSCTLSVSAPDVAAIYYSALDETNAAGTVVGDPESGAALQDAVLASMRSALESGGFTMRTCEVVVPIENGQAVLTYELADALYGGLLTLCDELTAQYVNGGEANE